MDFCRIKRNYLVVGDIGDYSCGDVGRRPASDLGFVGDVRRRATVLGLWVMLSNSR